MEKNKQVITIKAPNFQMATFKIVGTAPLVIHKMSKKIKDAIRAKQEQGDIAKGKKTKHEPRDFEADFNEARHISEDGWDGFHAGGLRAALISACRVAGYVMTRAKLTAFVIADVIDKEDQVPLVRIYGKPHQHVCGVRLDDGSFNLCARPMWDEWYSVVKIEFDADMLSLTDITHLLMRAGRQVGLCEGRPNSHNSAGCGWGTFRIEGDPKAIK